MKKAISALLAFAMVIALLPAFAGGEVAAEEAQQDIINKIELNNPEYSGNLVKLSGTHTEGAGEYITVKITDNANGEVYAMGEVRSKMGGTFLAECGLRSEAYGKDLTAYVSDGEGNTARCDVAIDISTAYEDFIVVDGITNTTEITLNNPVCTAIPVVISGTYSAGAGETMEIKIADSTNAEAVYTTATARTTSGGAFTFSATLPEEAYGKTLIAYVSCVDAEGTAYVKFYFTGGHGETKSTLNKLTSEIGGLIAECEAKGISVEYERVNLNVIKRFNGEKFMDYYASNQLAKEYDYNKKVLLELGAETIADLNAYLSGEKTAKVAPLYVSSDLSVDGQSFIGNVSINGEIKQQPIFFNGYGHWMDSFSDYGNFTELGINFAHYEVGPNSILKAGTGGNKYDINTAGVQAVKNYFKTAEENNLSLMFESAPHYFPAFIYEKYPGIDNNGSEAFPDFVPYNPTHDEVKEALEVYLRAVIPEIKDYKSFHSICLANEPFYIVAEYPDYYYPAYRAFLKDKYNNISTLNAEYGKSYASFDAVTMPKSVSATPEYIDYREFNDSILTEWFTWMVDVIRDIDPEIPVWAKCSAYISSAGDGRRRVFCGSNYEQWSEIFDINGCDAWAIYGEDNNTAQGKMMWYDFMTSMRNAPIVNGEDHILRDNKEITYRENELPMNKTDIWQGAIHGRAASAYWLWDKAARSAEGSIYYNSNLTRRADHIAAIGKLNLDMNRLANEITAIQKKDARCAVLYSNYTQVGHFKNNTNYHEAAMYEAYRYLLNNGEKVYIANDTYPERINENENLELLIVPACEYMPEAVWQEIKEFEERGKKVIFAEVSGDYKTHDGKAINSSLKNTVLGNAVRVSYGGWSNGSFMTGCENVYNAIETAIANFDRDIDAETSSVDVEWTAAEYNGEYVVNLCNYGENPADVVLSANGREILGEIVNLTENEEMSSSFTLAPYETRLVRISAGAGKTEFLKPDGTTAVKPEGALKVKSLAAADAGSEYVHIVAVYSENGTLVKFVSTSGTANENGVIKAETDIEVGGEKCTVKAFLFDGMNSLRPYLKTKVLE